MDDIVETYRDELLYQERKLNTLSASRTFQEVIGIQPGTKMRGDHNNFQSNPRTMPEPTRPSESPVPLSEDANKENECPEELRANNDLYSTLRQVDGAQSEDMEDSSSFEGRENRNGGQPDGELLYDPEDSEDGAVTPSDENELLYYVWEDEMRAPSTDRDAEHESVGESEWAGAEEPSRVFQSRDLA